MKMSELNFEDFTDTSFLWTLIFLLPFVSCSPVTGDFTMISPSQPVIAVPGDDVILPCQLHPALDVERFAVEWSNPDLKPDPSHQQDWVDVVFLYRHRREDLDMKLPSFINRTQLFTEELKHGNISLKILNVTSADTGRYRCFIPKLKAHAVVELVVDFKTRTTETPSYPGDLQTPDPRNKTDDEEVDQTRDSVWILPLVFFFLLVLTLIITGFLIKRQRQNQTQKQNHDVESDVALNTPS